MQGLLKAMTALYERGAANENGEGWTGKAKMQGYLWEGFPSFVFGMTVEPNDGCASKKQSQPRKPQT
eukprot:5556023-Pyramimonas_sp.AAC.1